MRSQGSSTRNSENKSLFLLQDKERKGKKRERVEIEASKRVHSGNTAHVDFIATLRLLLGSFDSAFCEHHENDIKIRA